MQRSLVFAAACAAMLCAADAGQWAKPAWIPREEGLYRSQVHRGGGVRTRPDNSMESFLWSWGHGMAPEADARLTKDGMVIAFHDNDLAVWSRYHAGVRGDADQRSHMGTDP